MTEESKPLETQIDIDWLNLNLKDPLNLDRLILKSTPEDDTNVSIYIADTHTILATSKKCQL